MAADTVNQPQVTPDVTQAQEAVERLEGHQMDLEQIRHELGATSLRHTAPNGIMMTPKEAEAYHAQDLEDREVPGRH